MLFRTDSMHIGTQRQFLLHKMLTNVLEWCGSLVDYCDVYQLFWLSFWRHPFTTEDPLVSKWWNSKFLQICSEEGTNSFTSWMSWRWGYIFSKFSFFGELSLMLKSRILLTCLAFPPLVGAVCMAFMISTGHNLHSAIRRERLRKIGSRDWSTWIPGHRSECID